MSDYISRQAAIDALEREKSLVERPITETRWFDFGLRKAQDVLSELPSAQPYTDKEIQKIQDLEQAEIQKAYDLGKLDAMEEMPKWIPCSERLPEDGENVLVTYKTTDKIHPCQYHDDGSRNPWYSYIDQCRAHMNVVLAWMPLPKPYEERRGE